MTRADRKFLAGLGVRLGAQSVFFPALMKARSSRLRALLWSAFHTQAPPGALAELQPPPVSPPSDGRAYRPPPGALDPDLSDSAHLAVGYRCFRSNGTCLALRADRLEQLVWELRKHSVQGSFGLTPEVCKRTALAAEDLALLLPLIGFQVAAGEDGLTATARGHRKRNGTRGLEAKSGPRMPARMTNSEQAKAGAKRKPRRATAKARQDPGPDSPFAKLRQMKVET